MRSGQRVLPSLSPWLVGMVLVAAAVVGGVPRPGHAQDKVYPKVNLSTSFVVDPAWPQRPAAMKWAEMSGIAVDAHDRLYLFTPSQTPVPAYATSANFLP